MAVDRRLFFQMHRAHRALFVHANAATEDALGVTTAQLGALYHVAKNEGCSLSAVADVLDMNKSAAGALIRRLEAKRVLRREPDPTDARASRLYLTESGKSVCKRSRNVVRRLAADATQDMSDADMDAVFRFLGAIVERYGV